MRPSFHVLPKETISIYSVQKMAVISICFNNNDGPIDYIISITCNGIDHACKIQNFVFKINLASIL